MNLNHPSVICKFVFSFDISPRIIISMICIFFNIIVSWYLPTGMGLHVRDSVNEYDICIES